MRSAEEVNAVLSRPKLVAQVHGDAEHVEAAFPHVLIANELIEYRYQHREDAERMLADNMRELREHGVSWAATLRWREPADGV